MSHENVALKSFDNPPPPPCYPETIIIDSLPQVKQDISELSKMCLIGKMLYVPLDIRTITAKTKADWKFIKGDVNYLDMGNHWLMFHFANPQDLSLVWSERPWHVQGDFACSVPMETSL